MFEKVLKNGTVQKRKMIKLDKERGKVKSFKEFIKLELQMFNKQSLSFVNVRIEKFKSQLDYVEII